MLAVGKVFEQLEDHTQSWQEVEMEATLETLVTDGQNLLSEEDDPVGTHSAHERWSIGVRKWLAALAPNSGLSAEWCAFGPSPLVREGGYHDDPRSWQAFRVLVRGQLRWLAEHGPSVQARAPRAQSDVWALLHPRVQEIASSRFDSGHYADAVEAALKALNAAVKARVEDTPARELDGSQLMNAVFSPKNPLLIFEDCSTASGLSVQQGYMQIFAGAMTGIRNPKAHDNISITAERAIHLLFVASLLWFKLGEALPPRQESPQQGTTTALGPESR